MSVFLTIVGFFGLYLLLDRWCDHKERMLELKVLGEEEDDLEDPTEDMYID